MTFEIKKQPVMTFLGYKKRFSGNPYDSDRIKQEESFFMTTRAKQWMLSGASIKYTTDFCIITNIDDGGYDFYIAYLVDEATRKDLFDPSVSGIDFIDKMDFLSIVIPEGNYIVYKTDKSKKPISEYRAIVESLNDKISNMKEISMRNAPHITAYHWRYDDPEKNRYIEVLIPIQ